MLKRTSVCSISDVQPLDRPINVSSIPLRSPFRYPGGKTWLVPRVRSWLASLSFQAIEFFEPFAGGGIIGLTVAAESLAVHVTMCELDSDIAAVWDTILVDPEGAKWLADRIVSFHPTPQSVREILADIPGSQRDRAFRTILRNRTARGGILAPGSALLNVGENGRGLLSRWYPNTLSERLLGIALFGERIAFVEGDGLDLIAGEAAHRANSVWFLDPPYSGGTKAAGKRLYTCCHLDHERLFNLASALEGDFLMTYEDDREIAELAKGHNMDMELVAMKNTHHKVVFELLIGRNLDWLRRQSVQEGISRI